MEKQTTQQLIEQGEKELATLEKGSKQWNTLYTEIFYIKVMEGIL